MIQRPKISTKVKPAIEQRRGDRRNVVGIRHQGHQAVKRRETDYGV